MIERTNQLPGDLVVFRHESVVEPLILMVEYGSANQLPCLDRFSELSPQTILHI